MTEQIDPQPEGQAPVTGYVKQPPEKVDAVNSIKNLENSIGEMMQYMREEADEGFCDPRMMAIARTTLQEGFMWWVRAIFQPESKL